MKTVLISLWLALVPVLAHANILVYAGTWSGTQTGAGDTAKQSYTAYLLLGTGLSDLDAGQIRAWMIVMTKGKSATPVEVYDISSDWTSAQYFAVDSKGGKVVRTLAADGVDGSQPDLFRQLFLQGAEQDNVKLFRNSDKVNVSDTAAKSLKGVFLMKSTGDADAPLVTLATLNLRLNSTYTAEVYVENTAPSTTDFSTAITTLSSALIAPPPAP